MSVSSAEPRARPGAVRVPTDLCVAAVLVLGLIDPAGAAVLSSAATSAGVIAALAAMLMIETWPAQFSSAALPALMSLVLVGGVVLWLRRSGLGNRLEAATAGGAAAGGGHVARAPVGAPSAPPVALPVDLDHAVLHAELESHFRCLQTAWDACDLSVLRALTTEHMLAELCAGRAGCLRAADAETAAVQTTVVTLQTRLLAFETLAETWVVSAEFSGWARESADDGSLPFREVWMLVAPRQGARAWRLARHHALL